MAGDWIKVRIGLWDDPAVIGIAATLGIDIDTVVGKLVRLWGWADQQLKNGYARNVTRVWIDVRCECEGFADALKKEGWLCDAEDGVVFPNFERHMGKCGKKRSQAQQRMQMLRKKRNTPVTQKASPEKRREEKRRDDDEVPSGTSCSEPKKSAREQIATPPELIGLELYASDHKLCAQWADCLTSWRTAYPALDIMAEVRKAHAWEIANKKNRKIHRARFLNNWLARAQDKSRRSFPQPSPTDDLFLDIPT